MSMKQIHIIKQLALELNVQASRDQDYHAISERLSVLGRERIPEIIDRVLSELVPPDRYVRYDKIVLDCNVNSLEELELSIRRQLADELERFVETEQQVRLLKFPNPDNGRQDVVGSPTGPAAWIVHFLEYGFLPWSAPAEITVASLAYELVELLANDPSFVTRLRRLLLQNSNCLKRMLAQFGELMLQRLTGGIKEEAIPPTLLSLPEQMEYWTQQLRLFTEARDVNTQKPKSSGSDDVRLSEKERTPSALLLQNNTAQKTALTVRQAGLVLLHPFINRFLTLHGAASNDEIVDPSLAASLLQSLVVGESPTAEWELVLPKVLLAIPLEEVLVLPKLTDQHLRSGEELIEAAIRHWSALGSTSVAGFRANFLEREGLLHSQGADWYLQVAQAPYDMLLDRLPWNVSMIKLPWMEGMLRVDFG